MQRRVTRPRTRPLPFADGQIDFPNCGPSMTARLVIRGAGSGIAIAACLGCRQLYPVEFEERRSSPGNEQKGPRP
jgi:hypothetical protein